MEDTKGKVLLSLLVGATAGAVAGLLLAPETGDEARAHLKKSAARFADSLAKRLSGTSGPEETPPRRSTPAPPRTDADRAVANELLQSLSAARAGGTATAADPLPDDSDSDYDGMGGDSRHYPGYRA